MIRNYKKKPVEIEAVEWTGDNFPEVHAFTEKKAVQWDANKPVIIISTLEGDMTAKKGDMIIKGVHGEFYPCKPDIFKETYEPSDILCTPKDVHTAIIWDGTNFDTIYNYIINRRYNDNSIITSVILNDSNNISVYIESPSSSETAILHPGQYVVRNDNEIFFFSKEKFHEFFSVLEDRND